MIYLSFFGGLLITLFVGLSFLTLFLPKIKKREIFFFSFIFGMAIQTIGMFFLDIFHIKLNIQSISCASILFILILFAYNINRIKNEFISFKYSSYLKYKNIFNSKNTMYFFFLILTIYIGYATIQKTLFWPTVDRDSVAGFETLSRVIAKEGTITRLSFFHDPFWINTQYNKYPPHLMFSYAYAYIYGAPLSKIINALYLFFFTGSLYYLMSKIISKTASIVSVFFILMTPEFMAWTSLSGTNIVHAMYASLGIICFIVAINNKENNIYFYLGCFLLAINTWNRHDGIVFNLIGGLIVLPLFYKQSNLLKTIFFCFSLFSLFLIWTLYLKLYNVNGPVGNIVPRIFFDSDKLHRLIDEVKKLILNTQYYGWTFIIFAVSLLPNLFLSYKQKKIPYLLLIIFLSFVLYLGLLYQIDYTWDTMENVIRTSTKRYFFCFIPLIWLSIVSVPIISIYPKIFKQNI